MNPENYASLEASKKLHEAGIDLKTDAVWYLDDDGKWKISLTYLMPYTSKSYYAPSMAEVWREIPECRTRDWTVYFKKLLQVMGESIAGYYSNESSIIRFQDTNPTCALIDLLIWVRRIHKQKGE